MLDSVNIIGSLQLNKIFKPASQILCKYGTMNYYLILSVSDFNFHFPDKNLEEVKGMVNSH